MPKFDRVGLRFNMKAHAFLASRHNQLSQLSPARCIVAPRHVHAGDMNKEIIYGMA
jgi:hypothetical protein